MLLRTYNLVLGVFLSVLLATGWIYYVFAWLEKHVGGWFPPIAIVLLCSPVVLHPLIKGVREGMREASQADGGV